MSDLEQRIDAWLDAELGAAGPGPVLPETVVRGAVRQARRVRRARVVTAVAAGLAVAAGTLFALQGPGSVSTTPRPPAGDPDRSSARPVDDGRGRPSPSVSDAPASEPGSVGTPVVVTYRGQVGETAVTWPASRNGLPWRDVRTAPLASDDRARALARTVRDRLSVGGLTAGTPNDLVGPPRVFGIDGTPTVYGISFQLVDGKRQGGATVLLTAGGANVDEQVWDACGRWPGRPDLLGGRDGGGPGDCALVPTQDPAGRPTWLVHRSVPADRDDGARREVFSVRPDGVAVLVSLNSGPGPTDAELPPRLQELPSWEVLDALALALEWPDRLPAGTGDVAVRYPSALTVVTGIDVRWPDAALGGRWTDPAPGADPGSPLPLPATAGARALQRAVLDAVPRSVPSRNARPVVGTLGTVASGTRGYVVLVDVGGTSGGSRWTVRATRGGLPVAQAGFDPCGAWPAGGLRPRDDALAAWLGDDALYCSVHDDGTRTVARAVVRPKEGASGRIRLSAFTVRPDGTAFAATVSIGQDAQLQPFIDTLDRLVLDLPYPSEP